MMKMRTVAFLRGDNGAVTVDWVTLTAAVIALAVSSVGAAQTGVVELGSRVTEDVTVPAE